MMTWCDENSIQCWWNAKCHSHLEVGIAGSYKVKHMIDPSILLLGIYLKEMKMCVHMKTYTKCTQWYYPQLPKTGNNPNILQYVNG